MADDRIDATETLLRQAVIEWGLRCSGDFRVNERDAAELLGISWSWLKQLREVGAGPRYVHRPVNGSRISYPLRALAEWIHARDEH